MMATAEQMDPVYVRCFKKITYIFRMLVGYSSPVFCAPLVKVETYENGDGSIFSYVVGETQALRCLFVLLVTCLQLLFGTVHPGMASFLPFVYIPLLEIDTMPNAAGIYFTELFFACFGQLVFTAATSTSGLCHRLALWFLRHTARGIELGIFTFMAEAMVISFWVDNATATVVMVSVVNETFSIIQKTTYIRMTQDTSLRDLNISSSNSGEDNIPITEELGDELMKLERMRQTSLIGVGFCATLGGMGMLTADVINLYLIGVLKEEYPHMDISPVMWCAFHLPLCFMLVVVTWAVLHFLSLGKLVSSHYRAFINTDLKQAIKDQVAALGPMTLHEGGVLFIYVALNALLFLSSEVTAEISRRSGFSITHTAVWAAFTVMLFVFPAESVRECDRTHRLLTWNELNNSMPWYTLLLASTCVLLNHYARSTGLLQLMRDALYENWLPHPLYVQMTICFATSVMCELCQNTVVVAIFVPCAANLADVMQVHPLYYVLAVYHAGTLSIMYPRSCVCNEIVFAVKCIKTTDMAIPGLIIKLIGICTSLISLNTSGYYIFNMLVPPLREPTESDI